MKLIIVESPKKCETIRRYLGEDYVVMASQGHIRDLSTHGKGGLGIDIENGFKPDWVYPNRKKEAIIAELSRTAKKSDEVLLATDPDREGEAISFHLAQVLNLPVETTKRLQFHEITKPEILKAIANPGVIDLNLVNAQEVRRMEDRIIGFKVSSLLKRNTGLKSAGRVQSATLRLIVDRQKVIDEFVPKEYWTIDVYVTLAGKQFKASLSKADGKTVKISNKEEAEALLKRIPSTLNISSLVKEEKDIWPKLPFTTSTMQQEAFNRFHFSNKRTQDLAQALYEGKEVNGEHVGLITYMRTDASRISPEFFQRHAKPFIIETYGDKYVGVLRKNGETKNMQDAHEAIRPTGTHRTPDMVRKYLTPAEANLYEMIYNRAMASLMAPKKVERTAVVLSGNGLDFTLSGSRTLFDGFSRIYREVEADESSSLPPLEEGQQIEITKVDPQQKFTKPDPQYNEASIVKAMEENGIGRPSTYANTIDNLIKHKYVTAVKGVLSPTEDGIKTIKVLEKYFPDIVSVEYTSNMEKKLDKVEEGETKFIDAMNDFYGPFMETFEEAKSKMYRDPDEPTGELCPECGKPLVYKKNKKGQKFIGCSGWPSCTYIKREEKKDEPVGENCPDCGAPLVYKKSGKGETFIGCSAFPKCRFTRNLNPKTPTVKKVYTEADYVKPCPNCKTGHLVVKQGKKTSFLGCTNFPKCRYHEWINDKKKGDE